MYVICSIESIQGFGETSKMYDINISVDKVAFTLAQTIFTILFSSRFKGKKNYLLIINE